MEKTQYILPFEEPLRKLEIQLNSIKKISYDNKINLTYEMQVIQKKIEKTKKDIYANLSAWQKVQIARHTQRPYALNYINLIFNKFQELHGDRNFRDDLAMIAGIGYIDKFAIAFIGTQKGRNTKENIKRNFGCPNPEGYRKALRIMRLANKFGLPIVTFVDTPGAYPGVSSEKRHIAEAIALNIREMSLLQVPIITVIIGEGGSGGALGIATSDIIVILENAYYSVISPEGCAAILWKDRSFAPDASEALHLTADKLYALKIVDEIIEEPMGGAHNNPIIVANAIKKSLIKHINQLSKIEPEQLLESRYKKYRKIGIFKEF